MRMAHSSSCGKRSNGAVSQARWSRVMLARLGEFDLPKLQLAKLLRNAEGKSVRRPHDLPEAGARASHADRIRRERCGCSALRSVPAINDLAA